MKLQSILILLSIAMALAGCRATDSKIRAWRVELRSTGRFAQDEGPSSNISTMLECTLSSRPSSNARVVEYVFQDVRCQVDGLPGAFASEVEDSFQGAVAQVEHDIAGRIRRIRFERDTPSSVRSLMSLILGEMQVGPPGTRTELDGFGQLDATYSREGEVLVRAARYDGAQGINATGQIKLEERQGSIRSLEGERAIQYIREGHAVAETAVSLRLVPGPGGGTWPTSPQFDEWIEPSVSGRPSPKELAQIDRQLAGEGGMSERLAECIAIDMVPFGLDQQEVANFASHQVQRIAAGARSEPSSLTPVAQWLKHLPVGSASWLVLHSGLCASGTEEAQGYVMSLLSDERTTVPLREAIASNLHAIEVPTIRAVRRLNDLIDGLDAACRTPALLTLGSWIGKIDPCEERASALARLQTLAQRGEQTAVLALGNSGLAEAFPYLARLAQDKEHSLRPDAVRALRKIPLSDADDILREALNADDAAVRTEAAFACGFRTSPMLFTAQSERLKCETDPCVRDQLSQNLARAEVGA